MLHPEPESELRTNMGEKYKLNVRWEKLGVCRCQGKSSEFLSDASKRSRNGDPAACQLCQIQEPVLISLVPETTTNLHLCRPFFQKGK